MITYENVLNYWIKKNIRTAADIRLVLDNFKILFAYNSNDEIKKKYFFG